MPRRDCLPENRLGGLIYGRKKEKTESKAQKKIYMEKKYQRSNFISFIAATCGVRLIGIL